jgi:hypothetical protein
MNPDLLPLPTSHPLHARPLRSLRSFIRANTRLRTTVLFGAFFICLFFYTSFLSSPRDGPWRKPFDWHNHPLVRPDANLSDTLYLAPIHTPPSTSPVPPDTSTDASHALPLQSPLPGDLTLEQIRDYVAPTRGFFTRDYSLGLGWNNVSKRDVPFLTTLNVSLIDAVYHRRRRPPSGIAQSHVGSPVVRLCTRLRVPYVCESFSLLSFAVLHLLYAATFVRTM